jgi:alpha-amylase/alpha-mannosidase (GH57 family)
MGNICIHAHFYQPARENPWLGQIETEDSAYPCQNWNELITSQCYTPNSAARILGPGSRIVDIVNNYSRISFNAGPTLLSWLENNHPRTYQRIIDADREGQKRYSGHGTAIAQPYNHMILPLASQEDKTTQVVWGIRDFEKRFGRTPEGMWIPEMAVDIPTLESIAAEGILYTILRPGQARRIKPRGASRWLDISPNTLDATRPYRCTLPSGRTITIFFYDDQVSAEVAFGDLLRDGRLFSQRLTSRFNDRDPRDQIVHIATDGETYGHHRQFGDMALAYALREIESGYPGALTVYGEYLEHHPPEDEVEIIENSSWSCEHGLERWRSGCTCKTSKHPDFSTQWRGPLREAMDFLHEQFVTHFVAEMTRYVPDPWQIRNDAIDLILDRSGKTLEAFFASHHLLGIPEDERVAILTLLEIQRNAMLMYTSDGWFFEDIAGIESVQVMRYAGRAMQLYEELSGLDLQGDFQAILKKAQGNTEIYPDGSVVYTKKVKPVIFDTLRMGAHYTLFSLFGGSFPENLEFTGETAEQSKAGAEKITAGTLRIRSEITRKDTLLSYITFQSAIDTLLLGIEYFPGKDRFSRVLSPVMNAFRNGDIPEIESTIRHEFGSHSYSLPDFSRDEQHRVIQKMIESRVKSLEPSLNRIYQDYDAFISLMDTNHLPLLPVLDALRAHIRKTELLRELGQDPVSLVRLRNILPEFVHASKNSPSPEINHAAGMVITSLLQHIQESPQDRSSLRHLSEFISLLKANGIHPDLWEAQNEYLLLFHSGYPALQEKLAGGKDAAAAREAFDQVGDFLGTDPRHAYFYPNPAQDE